MYILYRSGCSAVTVPWADKAFSKDGSVMVLGGWDGDFALNDVWRTTAEQAGTEWERMTDNCWRNVVYECKGPTRVKGPTRIRVYIYIYI